MPDTPSRPTLLKMLATFFVTSLVIAPGLTFCKLETNKVAAAAAKSVEPGKRYWSAALLRGLAGAGERRVDEPTRFSCPEHGRPYAHTTQASEELVVGQRTELVSEAAHLLRRRDLPLPHHRLRPTPGSSRRGPNISTGLICSRRLCSRSSIVWRNDGMGTAGVSPVGAALLLPQAAAAKPDLRRRPSHCETLRLKGSNGFDVMLYSLGTAVSGGRGSNRRGRRSVRHLQRAPARFGAR